MRNPCRNKKETNKGAWSELEDQKLTDYVLKHGLLRCGKSCRLRWVNYLRPNLKQSNFGEDEEDLIIKLQALLGNRWPLIAGRLPGRTANEVKNHWDLYLKRKVLSMGIDPNNRRSLLSWKSNHSISECQPLNTNPTTAAEAIGTSLPDLNLELTLSITND